MTLIVSIAGSLFIAALIAAVIYRSVRAQPKDSVPSSPPFVCDFSKYEVAVPLNKNFRFAHEPLGRDTNGRFVGRKAELEALALRILFSEGGSFLVTGYRGVGKTSFVNQVVRKLEEIAPWVNSTFGETRIVDIQLNLARPLTPAELMHHIIRRLYEEMRERAILSQLSNPLQDELKLAYERTSFNMTRTLGQETEKGLGVEQPGFGFLKALTASLSYKKKHTQGSEYEFVGYDDKAAEHDIVNVSRKLVRRFRPKTTFLARLAHLIDPNRKPKPMRLLIVFVFDELDKLEEFTVTQDGHTVLAIDSLLSALKNVFTTSGVSFIFVAGKDTQERWVEDLGKGDSVYESVFAYDKYLPCMWSDVNELCDGFIDRECLSQAPVQKFCLHCGSTSDSKASFCIKCHTEFPPPTIASASTLHKLPCVGCAPAPPDQVFCSQCGRYLRDADVARTAFEDFKKYLDYRGRGIPRRIIRGFNEYVLWNGERPILIFTKSDLRRIRVIAELQSLLAENEKRLFGEMHEEVWGTMRDKRRLGVYYVMDWIQRQGNTEFTVKDAVAASKRLSAKIAPAEEVALNVISEIVSVLIAGEFLMEVEERLDKVRIDDVSAKQEKRYKLVERRLIEMRGDADVFAADMFAFQQAAADTEHIGHYQLIEKIGTGGMGTVYRAWNQRNGQTVALKILSREFSADPQAVERFRRESAIMAELRHPNIVKCYETAEDNGRLFIAMEFVDGIDLNRVLSAGHPVPLRIALHIARALADALQYVHDKGFVRNDIKPGNIMLNRNGNIYLMDFGIAKKVSSSTGQEVTLAGTIVGTPYYMSPEQSMGDTVDERSDIYAFGVVLYQIVTGRLPFKGNSATETIIMHLNQTPQPPSQIVSDLPAVVNQIILRCLEKNPANRFPTASELLEKIKTVDIDPVMPSEMASFVSSMLEVKRNVEAHARQDTHEMLTPAPPPLPPPVVVPPPPSETAPEAAPPSLIPQDYVPASASSSSAPQPLVQVPNRAEPSIEALPQKAVVVVISTDDLSSTGKSYRLQIPRTTIGRAAGNDIVIASPFLSRFHADIEFRNGQYYVRDLNSGNGTLLNGLSLMDATPLSPDDVIQVGQTQLRFTMI